MFPGAARFKAQPLTAPEQCVVGACSRGGHVLLRSRWSLGHGGVMGEKPEVRERLREEVLGWRAL